MSIFEGLNTLPGFGSLFGSPPKMNTGNLQSIDVTYLHGRILSVGRPWNRRTEKAARRNNVDSLSMFLADQHKDHFLVLNLSVQNPFEKYGFKYQVLDCDLDMEPSMMKIFLLCQAAKCWLDMNSKNVIVVCCSSGISASRLFISCFLVYSGIFENTHEALEYFYAYRLKKKKSAVEILRKSVPSLRHFLNVFQGVLLTNSLPQGRPVNLYMVVFEHLPLLSEDNQIVERPNGFFSLFEDFKAENYHLAPPVISVYRIEAEKVLLFSSKNSPESIMHWDPMEAKFLLKADAELYGDIKIEVEFPTNSEKILFSTMIHTGFVEKSGVHAFTVQNIDTLYTAAIPEGFKMELIMQPFSASTVDMPRDIYKSRYQAATGLIALAEFHTLRAEVAKLNKLLERGYYRELAIFALQKCNNDLAEANTFLATLSGSSPDASSSKKTVDDISDAPVTCENEDPNALKTPDRRKSRSGELREQSSSKASPGRRQLRKSLELLDIQQGMNAAANENDGLSPFLREKFGHGLSSPGLLTPIKSGPSESVTVPYIDDQEMTSELNRMLDRLAEASHEESDTTFSNDSSDESQATQQSDEDEDTMPSPPKEKANNISMPVVSKVFDETKLETPSPVEEKPKEQVQTTPCQEVAKEATSPQAALLKEIQQVITPTPDATTGAQYDKYRSMLKMGVPRAAVALKMQNEELDPSVVGIVPEDNVVTEMIEKVFFTPDKAEDPKYNKFRKMLKMGVPKEAVVLKIRSEGLDERYIPELANLVGTSSPQSQLPTGRASVRRKKIHWEPVSHDRLMPNNSIWNQVQGTVDASPRSVSSMSPSIRLRKALDDEEEELEALFVETLSSPKKLSRRRSGLIQKPSMLEPRRSQNLAIALTKLKLDADVLCDAFLRFDSNVLTHEVLMIIQSTNMIPTDSEKKDLDRYRGTEEGLQPGETYFLKLHKRVPSPRLRVESMLFMCEFRPRAVSLEENIKTVHNACDEIMESSKLRRLFQVVLLVGNKLNAEAGNSVRGFTVASLLKLSQTKSFNNTTTILDYIVSFTSKRIPEALQIEQDLNSLADARKFDLSVFVEEITGLRKGLQGLISTIKVAECNTETLSSFASEAQETIARIDTAMNDMADRYCALLGYFAEDPELPMKEFFETLYSFCQGLNASVQSRERAEAIKARRSAQRLARFNSCADTNSTPRRTRRSLRRSLSTDTPRSAVKTAEDTEEPSSCIRSGQSELVSTPHLLRFLQRG